VNTGTTRDGCARVRGRLERYLDDALPPLERARDQGHLEACEDCAAELACGRELLGAIRRASAPAPRELELARAGLAEHLAGAAIARPRLRLLRGKVARAVTTAAAAVLALLTLELVGFGLGDVGELPGQAERLLERVDLQLPVWSDVVEATWLDGGGSR